MAGLKIDSLLCFVHAFVIYNRKNQNIIFYLGEKIDKVQSLNSHMQSIIDSKAQLLTRLQQPYVGEFIKLEAQYHRYVIIRLILF